MKIHHNIPKDVVYHRFLVCAQYDSNNHDIHNDHHSLRITLCGTFEFFERLAFRHHDKQHIQDIETIHNSTSDGLKGILLLEIPTLIFLDQKL